MNIKLIAVGKTDNSALQELITTYEKRLSYYVNFELQLLPDIKNSKSLSEEQQKTKEEKRKGKKRREKRREEEKRKY